MNIAFDVDGVLTDFEYFLDTYGHRYFSKKYKTDASVTNPYTAKISERFGYGDEEETAFYTRYLLWYSLKMPIRENAAVTIKRLRADGNKVYLITARALADRQDFLGKLMRWCLKRWLRKNHVEVDGIYYVSVKDSAAEKKAQIEKLKIDYMVEDDADNIAAIESSCKVICFTATYNKRLDGVERAIDFGDVYRIINCAEFKNFVQLSYTDRDALPDFEKKDYYKYLLDGYMRTPFDLDYLQKRQHFMKWFVPVPAYILSRIVGMRCIEGELPKDENGVIYVCNHRRTLDVPMCYCILKKVYPRVLTKREYEARVIGKLMKPLGIIFLDREKKESGKCMQNLMIQTLIHNGNILLFPEGTRNRNSEQLLPFKFGAVYMAQVTGCPIVPITIKRIKKNKHLIRVGAKMYVDVLDDLERKNKELYNRMQGMYDGV
jgi:1-acyl-sn-glycerol-3-phosphate acyltransferase